MEVIKEMTIGFLQQPVDPFPDPTHAGQEIENVGIMVVIFLIYIMFLLLMLYLCNRSNEPLPIIVVYLNGLWFTFDSMENLLFPFTPIFQVFFVMLLTSLFVMKALDLYKIKKR